MSYYDDRVGSWVIYEIINGQPVVGCLKESMAKAAESCSGKQRFAFWPYDMALDEGITWFFENRVRDDDGIPVDWHILSCDCLMHARSMIKICNRHSDLFASDLKYFSVAKA